MRTEGFEKEQGGTHPTHPVRTSLVPQRTLPRTLGDLLRTLLGLPVGSTPTPGAPTPYSALPAATKSKSHLEHLIVTTPHRQHVPKGSHLFVKKWGTQPGFLPLKGCRAPNPALTLPTPDRPCTEHPPSSPIHELCLLPFGPAFRLFPRKTPRFGVGEQRT